MEMTFNVSHCMQMSKLHYIFFLEGQSAQQGPLTRLSMYFRGCGLSIINIADALRNLPATI